jgi:serine protease Do
MTENPVECPKCSHRQHGGTECEACGVIFARYEEAKQRRLEQLAAKSEKRTSRSRKWPVALQFIAVVALTAGATYWLVRPRVTAPPAVQKNLPARSAEPVRPALPQGKTVQPAAAPLQAKGDLTSEDALHEATLATVTIETPWGTGSGFFISDGLVVTNRHVIEADPHMLAELRHTVDTNSQFIDLEKEKLRNYRARLREMPQGPSRGQLKLYIEERQRAIDKVLPKLEKANQQLDKMEAGPYAADIKVVYQDGTTYQADYFKLSDNYDLALISVNVMGKKFLKPPPKAGPMHQGDRVYTIGSPLGLSNTVTSGIFSGYRKRESDGHVFLQTDAPINPGNSGGPLVDEHGYVRGVNTMILKNTEGIGFAIPIDVVFQEFSSSLS